MPSNTTTDQPTLAVTSYRPDIVLYHANCADGFGAAWACWMRWRDGCEYQPASYGQEPPDVSGKHVLLVDFSYKRDVLREMGRKAASVIVLDHHKTAEADLSDWAIDDVAGMFWAGDDPLAAVRVNDEYVGQPVAALFDMNKSGARLAWEFCHDEPAPDLIALVEDRDLWRFTDERTKPFSLWLRARPFDFADWELIAQELNDANDGHRIMTEAVAMQTFSDQVIADIASRARQISIAGFDVPAVDCPPNFASEVCHALLVKNPDAPFAAAYSDNPNGKRGWSLRSQDHRQDVSEIAKRFGGGGHRNAAGFGEDLARTNSEPRPAGDLREALARKLCEQHGGDPDAVASEPHDCWEGALWTAFVKEADDILAITGSGNPAPPSVINVICEDITCNGDPCTAAAPMAATDTGTRVEKLREAITQAIARADAAFGYAYRMTKMDDAGEEHTLFMDGFEPAVFEDRADGYPVLEERRNTLRAKAVLAALATHSPAPMAGWPDHKPLVCEPEVGPEPSLREIVRFYYVYHGQPDPEADTAAYFAAHPSTQEGGDRG